MSRTKLKWREFESFNEVLEAGIQWMIAKTLFATAWADWDEQYGNCVQSGSEIFDVMPEEIPNVCFDAATKLTQASRRASSTPILELLQRAADAREMGYLRNMTRSALEDLVDEFGYYMAMEALGHGVSWEDRYKAYERPTIHYEFGYYDLPDDKYPVTEEEEEPDGDTE